MSSTKQINSGKKARRVQQKERTWGLVPPQEQRARRRNSHNHTALVTQAQGRGQKSRNSTPATTSHMAMGDLQMKTSKEIRLFAKTLPLVTSPGLEGLMDEFYQTLKAEPTPILPKH